MSVQDVGLALVGDIRKRLQIDEKWSCSDPNGFRWWGDNLMQQVWADPARESYGLQVQCVHASTTILKDVPDRLSTRVVLSTLNAYADMSVLVYSPADGSVSLQSTVYVHDAIVGWLSPLFAHAVALQVAKASQRAAQFQQAFGGELATSSHPTTGAARQQHAAPVGLGDAHRLPVRLVLPRSTTRARAGVERAP
jgi:hypothetical protein